LRPVPGGALTIGIYANFEAFDFADVKIIRNCRYNKLYFMQYYTELYINAETLDLLINIVERSSYFKVFSTHHDTSRNLVPLDSLI
jgi:hypothetical protein